DHETAADYKCEEDAKPHHQPAPWRHGDIAGRLPSVMADIDCPDKEREKKITTNRMAPSLGRCSDNNAGPRMWCRCRKVASAILRRLALLALKSGPRRSAGLAKCRKGNPNAAIRKKQPVGRLPTFGYGPKRFGAWLYTYPQWS